MGKRRWLSDPEEVVGKTDFDFFPKELANRFMMMNRTSLLPGNRLFQKLKDPAAGYGTAMDFDHQNTDHRQENQDHYRTCGISHDISHATKMEEELDREREMFRLLMDNSPDNIYFKDLDSRFPLLINPRPSSWDLLIRRTP